MSGNSHLGESDDLYPSEGYTIVVWDKWKPPGHEEYQRIYAEFDDANFELPPETPGHEYYVHTSDGEVYTRDSWPPDL